MAKRKICWLKWSDPIAHIVQKDGFETDEFENSDEDNELNQARNTFAGEIAGKTPENIGPCLVGPLGIIPLYERNIPSKTYNFWMGHANFKITYAVADTIVGVQGIEDLLVFSRYRFRICIGHAFNDKEVRLAVEQAICQRKKKRKTDLAPAVAPDKIKFALLNRYKYWAVIQLSPSHYDYAFGNTREEVEDQLKNKQIPVGVGVIKSYH